MAGGNREVNAIKNFALRSGLVGLQAKSKFGLAALVIGLLLAPLTLLFFLPDGGNFFSLAFLQSFGRNLRFSFELAALASIVSVSLGLGCSLLLLFFHPSVKFSLLSLAGIALISPAVVIGLGWIKFFQAAEPWLNAWFDPYFIYSKSGLLLNYVYYNLAFALLVFSAALSKIPIENYRLRELYGFSLVKTWRLLIFPAAQKTLFLLLLAIFFICLYEFNLASFLINTAQQAPISVALYRALFLELDFVVIGQFIHFAFVVAVICWLLFTSLGSYRDQPSKDQENFRLTPSPSVLAWLVLVGLFVFFSLPYLALIFSFTRQAWLEYWSLGTLQVVAQSLGISALVASHTIFWAILYLYAAAYLTARRSRRRPNDSFSSALGALPFLYAALPSAVLSLVFFLKLKDSSFFYSLSGYIASVVVLQSLFFLPYAYLFLKEPFHLQHKRYASLSASLNLSFAKHFRWVFFPWFKRYILTAWCLVFAFSLGDLSVFSFLGKRFATFAGLSVDFSSHYKFDLATINSLNLLALCGGLFFVSLMPKKGL